jgi:hypothetical protein
LVPLANRAFCSFDGVNVRLPSLPKFQLEQIRESEMCLTLACFASLADRSFSRAVYFSCSCNQERSNYAGAAALMIHFALGFLDFVDRLAQHVGDPDKNGQRCARSEKLKRRMDIPNALCELNAELGMLL